MKRVLLFFCLWVACTAVGRSQRLVAVGKGIVALRSIRLYFVTTP